jgi:hypothetical protein
MQKTQVIFVIVIILLFLYDDLLGGIMHDFISLIKMRDIISCDKTLIFMSAIPLLIFMLYASLLFLFQKKLHTKGA